MSSIYITFLQSKDDVRNKIKTSIQNLNYIMDKVREQIALFEKNKGKPCEEITCSYYSEKKEQSARITIKYNKYQESYDLEVHATQFFDDGDGFSRFSFYDHKIPESEYEIIEPEDNDNISIAKEVRNTLRNQRIEANSDFFYGGGRRNSVLDFMAQENLFVSPYKFTITCRNKHSFQNYEDVKTEPPKKSKKDHLMELLSLVKKF